MKNIHVLPTEKSSRLFVYDGKLGLAKGFQYGSDAIQNHNIYITSDERIERGDWVFDAENEEHIYRASDVDLSNIRSLKSWYCKKIILTTDVDLIKYGVQAIDDEFLEWFVKNPSCEEVEVEEEDYSQKCRECGETVKRGYSCKKGCFMKSGNFIPTDENIKYKIIIPKEEPKQETLEDINTRYHQTAYGKLIKELTEQETLEEAKAHAWIDFAKTNKDVDMYSFVIGFDKGYKLAQHWSYSEEEAINIFFLGRESLNKSLITKKEALEVIKQFKKK